MAIMQRFWTVMKSNLNAWIGRVEDPEKMLNQMLLDMQEQLVNAKRQVAIAIADEKRLSKQAEQEMALVQEWEKKAMLAVRAGDDDLARQALTRKSEHEKLAHGYQEQWQSQKGAVEQLKVALQNLSNKIEDAKRKKNLLIARARRADAQRMITDTMSGISKNSAFDTISRMEEKIDRMEAEAQATTELAEEIVTDELSAKFEKLHVPESDDALQSLKQKMGVASAPAQASLPAARTHEDELKEIQRQIEVEIGAKR